MQYTSIFIAGFRATGKTTIGKLLAEKLGWDFIDMDEKIELKAGMPVNQITQSGTEWQTFRQLEHDVLKELITKEKIVVSMGGGTAVNDIVKEGSATTFGRLNQEILRSQKQALIVLLTASDEIIAERMRRHEMRKDITKRPILSEKRAQETQKHLKNAEHDLSQQKEILINEIVSDALETYNKRKPLYAALTKHVVDTGEMSAQDAVTYIMQRV